MKLVLCLLLAVQQAASFRGERVAVQSSSSSETGAVPSRPSAHLRVGGRRGKSVTQAHTPRITVCVLDLGRGIPTALRTVPKYRRHGDGKLIELATRQGVSSAPGSRGMGLSTIRRFVRANGGDVTIMAGRGRVKFRADRRPEQQRMDFPFPGTAAFLSLVPTARGMFVLGEEEEDEDNHGEFGLGGGGSR